MSVDALAVTPTIVPVDRGVKTLCLYAFMRHPMDLGYIIAHIGFLVGAQSLWNAAVYAVIWVLLVARIFFEERFLSLTWIIVPTPPKCGIG